MKFLANIIFGVKQVSWFLWWFLGIVFLELSLVLILYMLAVEARIPLTNFDVFMKSIYSIVAISSLSMGIILAFLFLEIKKKKIAPYLILNGIVALIAAYQGDMHLRGFLTLLSMTILSFFICSITAILCSIFFRVVMNRLFRQLFTQEFQEQCEVYPDEDTLFYSIKWIKRVMDWLYFNFRDTNKTYFSPSDFGEPYKEMKGEFNEDSPFSEEPKLVFHEPLWFVIQFKYVPQQFRIQPRTWFSQLVEEPMLLNGKSEK